MESKKVSRTWKVIAIILLGLFSLMVVGFLYGTYKYKDNYDTQMYCYYTICSEETDAIYDYSTRICNCYNYDFLGNQIVTKTEYLK